MDTGDIINTILFAITIIGLLFSVWFKVKDPQEKLDKKQAINEERDKNKTERIDFGILKTQFDMMCKINSDTFAKLELQIKEAFIVANNHTNETDSKVTGLVLEVGNLRNDVTRLATIIEERIPKKV